MPKKSVLAGVGVLLFALMLVVMWPRHDRSVEAAGTTAPSSSTTASTLRVQRRTTTTHASTSTSTSTRPTSTVAPLIAPRSTAPAPAPPPTTAQPPTTVPPTTAPAPTVWTLAPYRGLGTWLDVLDWSPTYTNGQQAFELADLDHMAAIGIQTVFIQTSRYNRSEAVLDPSLLRQIIARAHADHMQVVGWYLPTLVSVSDDLRHLTAAGALPLDGLAVDIESTAVADASTRSARLAQLDASLDATYRGRVLGAITLPPVVTEVINPNYWPGLPWHDLAAHYDVFLPMSYWSGRTAESGWHDGYKYTKSNVEMLRSLLGRPSAPVHAVGGVGAYVTSTECKGLVRAIQETGAIGGSLYDYETTSSAEWSALYILSGLG